jgi:hypothetical protein
LIILIFLRSGSTLFRNGAQMTLTTTEEIYEQIIKPLPAAERLRLVGKIVHDLSIQPIVDRSPERHDWMSLRGVAPKLLDGEGAQKWVSRTRRESDEDRELVTTRRERSVPDKISRLIGAG